MLVLTISLTAVISSCGGDDDSDGNSDDNSKPTVSAVVGIWTSTESDSYRTKTLTLVFSQNGTGTWSEVKVYSDGSKTDSTDKFTYHMTSATEGLMTVTEVSSSSGKVDIDEYKFVISGKTMLIYEIESAGSLDLEETLTKK